MRNEKLVVNERERVNFDGGENEIQFSNYRCYTLFSCSSLFYLLSYRYILELNCVLSTELTIDRNAFVPTHRTV